MPDLSYLFRQWWKQMAFTVVCTTVVVAVILIFIPSKYLGVATALPANTYATDKASVFSQHTQTLYPALGTPEDLDMIIGTAHLDTIYISVARRYELPNHYRIHEQGDAAWRKAALLLKKNTSVIKSEYNELKVKVWDVDRDLAPQLANSILETVQAIHREMQNRHNITMLNSLHSAITSMRTSIDSMEREGANTSLKSDARVVDKSNALQQLHEYETLANQYRLLADNRPEALIIVERAHVSDWPDQPRRPLLIVATFVLSIFLSILVAVLLEKRNTVS
jgi:hypothetical protein